MKKLALAVVLSAASITACANETDVMEGLPEHLIYLYTSPAETGDAPYAQRQLVAGERRWEPGRKLRVCTFGGNRVVAALIRKTASEWNNYSSVQLDFGPEPSGYNCLSPNKGFFQIRIGFSARGYWSVLGTDSESRLDPLVPSMNLESFNTIYSEARYSVNDVISGADKYHKAVILHEFGHALALLHEHQNPVLDCQSQIIWSGPGNVFDYFGGPPNKWTRSEVERNLGYISTTDQDYIAGQPDPASIMMYSLPVAIFKKTPEGKPSNCAAGINYAISAKDKAILAKIYPIAAGSPQQLPIDVGLANNSMNSIPAFAPSYNKDDMLSRVVSDLESDDTYTRRNARIRLSALLKNDATKEDIAIIVEKMPHASYRYQLGVSSALANAPSIKLSEEGRKKLLKLERSTLDSTLRNSLKAANK